MLASADYTPMSEEVKEIYAIFSIEDFQQTNALDSVEKYGLIGIEQNTPYLKLGNLFFQGKMTESVGTMLCFEKQDGNVEYIGKTDKIVECAKIKVREVKSKELQPVDELIVLEDGQ